MYNCTARPLRSQRKSKIWPSSSSYINSWVNSQSSQQFCGRSILSFSPSSAHPSTPHFNLRPGDDNEHTNPSHTFDGSNIKVDVNTCELMLAPVPSTSTALSQIRKQLHAVHSRFGADGMPKARHPLGIRVSRLDQLAASPNTKRPPRLLQAMAIWWSCAVASDSNEGRGLL
jgi:hypothetical protein